MGNSCCRGEASSSSSSSMEFPHFHSSTERESLLDNKTSSLPSYKYSSANDYDKQHKEVKIKITKEKLEELLAKDDVHGMSVDQVLARLLSASADHHYYDPDLDVDSHHHRSWRPALQTIPELLEILIKIVAQAIPTYTMQCFAEKLCRSFYWGQKDGERKMVWISWTSLCRAKSEGGTGMRDFGSFNKALLAKQGYVYVGDTLVHVADSLES